MLTPILDGSPHVSVSERGRNDEESDPLDDLMRPQWIRGTSELARLKQLAQESRVRTTTLLVEGLPYEAIVENSCGFDLLVIEEPQAKWNFFSRHTARRVIEQAKCPVHVVRQETGLGDYIHRSEANVAA
jgi:hypothetical protein